MIVFFVFLWLASPSIASMNESMSIRLLSDGHILTETQFVIEHEYDEFCTI